jgi:hypothetical protein
LTAIVRYFISSQKRHGYLSNQFVGNVTENRELPCHHPRGSD